MIIAAGLLVLGGLGLFVAGVLTGVTTFYWACVAACVVAAVLLFLARRRMSASTAAPAQTPAAASRAAVPAPAAATSSAPASGRTSSASASAAPAGAAAADSVPAAAVRAPSATEEGPSTGRHAVVGRADAGNGVAPPPTAAPAPGAGAVPPAGPAPDAGDPPVEEVEVTDLLLVVELKDEVLVVDEHPRYHVAGCRHLAGQDTFPLPVDEAKSDGFTPCGTCRPDATLADRVRAARRSSDD